MSIKNNDVLYSKYYNFTEISNDILDVVEELPDDIYDFLVSQYNSCK